MKRNLIHISRAFIAALLLFAASSFAATAQQLWEQEVEVLFKPELTLQAGANLMISDGSICIGETITITFKGKAPFQLKYNETTSSWFPGGNDTYVTYSTSESGNLKLTELIAPDPNDIGTYTATLTPDATGTFSFTGIMIKDANGDQCSPADITITNFKVNAIPSITLPNTSVCQGADVTATIAGGTAPYELKYTWGGGNEITQQVSSTPFTKTTDQAGTFVFHLVSLIDANGCAAGTTPNGTVTVWETPNVTVNTGSHELTLCEGATLTMNVSNRKVIMTGGSSPVEFTFTGEGSVFGDVINMHYSITKENGTTNELSTSPSLLATIPIPAFDVLPAQSFNYTINSPGQWRFTITSLIATVAPTCTNNSFAGGYADLTVRPLPTVTFSGNPICEDDPLTLEFTGSGSTPTFNLDYKYAYGATDITANQNLQLPSVLGLPDAFTPTASGSADANGITTYTQTINPGAPGKFKFYLHTISDGTCVNTNPNTPSWKWW